jgi:hypothetical protein
MLLGFPSPMRNFKTFSDDRHLKMFKIMFNQTQWQSLSWLKDRIIHFQIIIGNDIQFEEHLS